MKYILLFCCLLFLLISCEDQKIESEGEIIARVYDDYLYYEDFIGFIPELETKDDSDLFLKTYVESWITKKLVGKIAEENVPKNDLEIDELINSYRNSLIIFRYQQNYIAQNLDTNISNADLLEFYNLRKSDFILEFNAIKCLYIVVPKSAPEIYKLRNWYRSDNEKNIKNLDVYCSKYAFKYDDFNNDWVSFNQILEEMPAGVNDQEVFLKYSHSLETSDSSMHYFLKITDYKLKNDTTPLIFIKGEIKDIILSKRKKQLLQKLEKNIYQDGLASKDVEIFK